MPAQLRRGASDATIAAGAIAILCGVFGLVWIVKLLDGGRKDESETAFEVGATPSHDSMRSLIVPRPDSGNGPKCPRRLEAVPSLQLR